MVTNSYFGAAKLRTAESGTTMIEILVTVVIIVLGLLGLAGLHARLQVSETESYQRGQALLLVADMANRIELNRSNAASYLVATTAPLGPDTCPTAATTLVQRDLREWCQTLQGAAEVLSGQSVGAVIGARGCVESVGVNEYLVTVAWQGLAPISAPPATIACGKDAYNSAATSCINDLCRRYVTTLVRIATL